VSDPPDPLRHALPPAGHDAIYRERIRPLLIRGEPSPAPRVTIMGGQPGSGKSYAMAALPDSQRAGVVIASDRLRVHHPLWPQLLRQDDTTAGTYTSHDARGWVADAIRDAIGARLNVIFDTASDDPDRVRRIVGQFRAGGYTVDMAFVAAASAVSRLSVLSRYQDERDATGGGRYVADPDRSHPGVLATAVMVDQDRLADSVTVYSRSGQLYRNDLGPDGRWARPPGTAAAIEGERERPWTRAESENFQRSAIALSQRMGRRWQPLIADIARAAEPLMHPAVEARPGARAAEAIQPAPNPFRSGLRGQPGPFAERRRPGRPRREPDRSPEAEP
jgi:UDP-N-acetylglucosamine kinase